MRLTNLADYGVVIMVQAALAQREMGAMHWLTAPSVAQATGLTLPTVTKIIGLLARAGLLTTQRGAHGGFRLAAPAVELNVAQIVEAVDGPIALTLCADHGADVTPCAHQSACHVGPHWQIINATVRDALAALALADLAQPVAQFAVRPPIRVSMGA